MNWLARFLGRWLALAPEHAAALARYRGLPAVPGTQPLASTGFVVLDVETTGLNPYRDRLLSIGAVRVCDERIRIGDAFEVVLRQAAPSDPRNILVHGIDGTTQMSGRDTRDALIEFTGFAGRAPLVGYHVDFDRIMIDRAMRRVLGMKLANDWIDLARVVPALFPRQATQGRGLDYWLGVFGIENFARHAAVADALATGQLLQVVLRRAMAAGLRDYGHLRRLDDDQRWIEHTQGRA